MIEDLEDYVSHFQLRVLVDAFQSGTATFWERRAVQFEWARPRPGRRSGPEDAERDRRCAAVAAGCRLQARLFRGEIPADDDPDVALWLADEPTWWGNLPGRRAA